MIFHPQELLSFLKELYICALKDVRTGHCIGKWIRAPGVFYHHAGIYHCLSSDCKNYNLVT